MSQSHAEHEPQLTLFDVDPTPAGETLPYVPQQRTRRPVRRRYEISDADVLDERPKGVPERSDQQRETNRIGAAAARASLREALNGPKKS